MMTSSNGNIFRVTGPLCGEFTGPGEFPTQRRVTRSFDVFFDLRLNKRLSKQLWGWWFKTPSWSLWRQCNVATSKCVNIGYPAVHIVLNTTTSQKLYMLCYKYHVTLTINVGNNFSLWIPLPKRSSAGSLYIMPYDCDIARPSPRRKGLYPI